MAGTTARRDGNDEWRHSIEDKLDRLIEAVSGPNGVNVRLSVLETRNDELSRQISRLNGAVECAVKSAAQNAADILSVRGLLRVHWALIALIITSLVGIAFGVMAK